MELRILRARLRRRRAYCIPLCSFCVRGGAAKPKKAVCIVASKSGGEWWACETHRGKHRISAKSLDDYFAERGEHGPVMELFK